MSKAYNSNLIPCAIRIDKKSSASGVVHRNSDSGPSLAGESSGFNILGPVARCDWAITTIQQLMTSR